MNLTVYLLRDVVSELGQLQRKEGYRELKPNEALPFPCVAWVQASRSTPPKWMPWLGTAFDLEDLRLKNQSNAFVMFLQVDGRVFALTFGFGLGAIDRKLIEPDFGLKVVLNEVDPDALDMVDTRRVDRVSRQRRTHLNAGRNVGEFDISTELDWLQKVSGRPLSTALTKKMVGADSLKLSMKCTVEELGAHCQTFLTQYRKTQYKKHFGFIDYLRPLKARNPLIPVLEEHLVGLLKDRSHEELAVAFPEMPDERITRWRLSQGHQSQEFEDLDIEGVYDFLEAHPEIQRDPQKIRVRGLNDDGEVLTSNDNLHRYLVAQVEHARATYVLSLGQWFRVDTDYISKVRERVRQIADVTAKLQLPKWSQTFKKEGAYNKHVGKTKNWLVLDAKPFYPDGHTGKMEVCDLLSPNRDFIHVKSMKDSATLSHLFGQGSVSARLFRSVPAHADKVRKFFHDHYGSAKDFDGMKGSPRVVYAIATRKQGALADTLFFFSVVNLLEHVKTVRLAGFDVALCRIER
ncbi:DUF6119 family protein [Corallococcus coralloides]|uniref:DUF6119 family protein n=1 Tax=Corallococcus coralloides TaxID=184914 RepID=UPI00384ADF79